MANSTAMGGQGTIARFGVGREDALYGFGAEVVRYWNIDREDPRGGAVLAAAYNRRIANEKRRAEQ